MINIPPMTKLSWSVMMALMIAESFAPIVGNTTEAVEPDEEVDN